MRMGHSINQDSTRPVTQKQGSPETLETPGSLRVLFDHKATVAPSSPNSRPIVAPSSPHRCLIVAPSSPHRRPIVAPSSPHRCPIVVKALLILGAGLPCRKQFRCPCRLTARLVACWWLQFIAGSMV